MKKFTDLQIEQPVKGFIGEKIKIGKVLNRAIVIHDFKAGPSKYNDGDYLNMQISIGDKKHVLMTGSQVLLDTIRKVPKEGFPFETTIVEEDERYQFT